MSVQERAGSRRRREDSRSVEKAVENAALLEMCPKM